MNLRINSLDQKTDYVYDIIKLAQFYTFKKCVDTQQELVVLILRGSESSWVRLRSQPYNILFNTQKRKKERRKKRL